MNHIPADLHAAMREIVRYAIITMAALRDPDARYLGWSSLPANVVHDVQEAYGYSSTSVRSFRPTPHDIEQMEVVLPWVAWLRRQEGELACRRLMSWAMGASLWRLGQREQCTDRTITNRIDRSISAIILNFTGADIAIEVVDEPYKGTNFALIYDKPAGPHGHVTIRKVYVGGVGFFKNGKKLREATDKFDLERIAI